MTRVSKPQNPREQWLIAGATLFVLVVFVIGKGGMFASVRGLGVNVVAATFLLTTTIRVARGDLMDRWEWAWLSVWAFFTAYLLLQIAPLPTALLQTVGTYSPMLDNSVAASVPVVRLSPNMLATLSYWAMFTTYWVVAYWTASLHRQVLGRLVAVLVIVAAFEATYGFVAYIGQHKTVLGLWTVEYSGVGTSHDLVRGTFVNRNHMASLLAVCWPLAIAYLLYGTSTSRRIRAGELNYFLLFLVSVVIALALFNSKSRLGVMAAFVGLLVFYLIARANSTESLSLSHRLWLWTSGGVSLAIASWFGIVPLLDRYTSLLAGEGVGRFEAWASLSRFPAQAWLFGIGAGAFEDAFKLVQPAFLSKSLLRAHNDWLQFVLEFGILGSLLMAGALWFWFIRVRPPCISQLQVAACGGVAAMGLHSIGDFNLQIPGAAIVFWITVGVLFNRDLATAVFKHRSRSDRQRSSAR